LNNKPEQIEDPVITKKAEVIDHKARSAQIKRLEEFLALNEDLVIEAVCKKPDLLGKRP
jgi:hypothetical protein